MNVSLIFSWLQHFIQLPVYGSPPSMAVHFHRKKEILESLSHVQYFMKTPSSKLPKLKEGNPTFIKGNQIVRVFCKCCLIGLLIYFVKGFKVIRRPMRNGFSFQIVLKLLKFILMLLVVLYCMFDQAYLTQFKTKMQHEISLCHVFNLFPWLKLYLL